MSNYVLLMLALVGGVSAFFQVVSWWARIPVIVFLLIAGILLGPTFHLLDPDKVFGHVLFPLISLAVAIILFEGSLTLRFEQIRGQGNVVFRLVTKGVLISWVCIAVAAHYFFEVAWGAAFLFGAIMIVSGPTVITPLVRAIRPKVNLAHILRWEGIAIDPIGGLLAVIIYGWIETKNESTAVLSLLLNMGLIFGFGFAFGLLNGFLMSAFLKRRWLPDSLLNICVLNWVIIVYVLSSFIVDETGLLAVTIMGVVVGNRKNVPLDAILDFKETLSTLLLSGLFIILAARIETKYIHVIFWYSIVIFFLIQFVIRPLSIFICTWGSALVWREKLFLSWIAPRGIVAAAVASLFALKLEEMGYPQAYLLIPIVFLIIVYSVILPSLTGRFVGKLLGVIEPDPTGVLIIGANKVCREIAKVLVSHDIAVTLASVNWENVSTARLEGFVTYYGNPVSLHAERNLNLIGYGKMFAITPNQDLNTLSGIRYKNTFGADNIYYLLTSTEKKQSEKLTVARKHVGVNLFKDEVTYQQVASLLSQGWVLKSTTLSEQFDFQAYLKQHEGGILPFCVFTPKNKLVLFTQQADFTPEAGWTVVSFIKPQLTGF